MLRRLFRVLVVDDYPPSLEALKSIICDDSTLQFVAGARNGQEAIELAERLRPDVVLSDIRMPGMDGIELTRCIKRSMPEIVVILITSYETESYLVEGRNAGAYGILPKDASVEVICDAVISAVREKEAEHEVVGC